MNRRGFFRTLYVAPLAMSMTPVALREPAVRVLHANAVLYVGHPSPDGEVIYTKVAEAQELHAFGGTF